MMPTRRRRLTSHVVGESRPPAVLAFDAAGRLLHRSATAAALLNALGDPAEAIADVPRDRHTVPAVVAGVVARRPATGSHVVAGRDGGRYVLHVLPGSPDATDGAPSTYVLIATADADGSTSDHVAALAARHGLSPREEDVLRRVAHGDANKAIAAALGLSTYTVQEYVGRACLKVGVRTRRELVARLLGG